MYIFVCGSLFWTLGMALLCTVRAGYVCGNWPFLLYRVLNRKIWSAALPYFKNRSRRMPTPKRNTCSMHWPVASEICVWLLCSHIERFRAREGATRRNLLTIWLELRHHQLPRAATNVARYCPNDMLAGRWPSVLFPQAPISLTRAQYL